MPWSRGPDADHEHAIEMAEMLIGIEGVSDAAVYNAACAYSLAGRAAEGVERERRLKRALELLQQIAGRGYFDIGRKYGELQQDSDLDPLRNRGEFQAGLPLPTRDVARGAAQLPQ